MLSPVQGGTLAAIQDQLIIIMYTEGTIPPVTIPGMRSARADRLSEMIMVFIQGKPDG
jgi:hypothetical protein